MNKQSTLRLKNNHIVQNHNNEDSKKWALYELWHVTSYLSYDTISPQRECTKYRKKWRIKTTTLKHTTTSDFNDKYKSL